jgi:hypothetical protein
VIIIEKFRNKFKINEYNCLSIVTIDSPPLSVFQQNFLRKGLKMEFINPWNVEGAFVREKCMTKNS